MPASPQSNPRLGSVTCTIVTGAGSGYCSSGLGRTTQVFLVGRVAAACASAAACWSLGIEPGRELQELERAILNQDPELGGPSRRLPRPPARRRGALLLALGGLILAGAAVAAVLSLGGGTSSGPVLRAVDRVGMIDPRTGAVLASRSVPGTPARPATDGRELWVGGDASQTLQRIDPGSPPTVVPVNGFPSALAMGEGSLWMVDALRRTLVKVNPAYGTVVARKSLTGAAREVAISDRAAFDPRSVAAGAGVVWVSDGSSRVYRVDPQSARLVRAPNLGTPIDGLAAAGNAVWAISGNAATALRLDPGTGRVTTRIPIVSRPGLESPYPIAIAAGAGFVWVLNANSGTVTKIDPIARGIATTIPIGVDRGPLRLAAGAGAAWVANGDGTLSRIDASSNAVRYFPIAHGLTDVAVAGDYVWVTAGPGPGPQAGAGAPVSGPAVTSVRALPASSCAPVLSQAGQRPRYLIASDMPLQGTGSELPLEMTDAIRFILQRDHFRAGRFSLGYQACDNSIVTPRGPPEENARCAPNARAFADDPSVIAVIGPFFSECASIEIPIANRATQGPLAMIAPAATAVGLTHAGPGAGSGEPGRYYPTGQRNFARVIPADNVQGAADAMLAQTLGANRLFVLDDHSLYGSGVAGELPLRSHPTRTPRRRRKPLAIPRPQVPPTGRQSPTLRRHRRIPRRIPRRRERPVQSPARRSAHRTDAHAGRLQWFGSRDRAWQKRRRHDREHRGQADLGAAARRSEVSSRNSAPLWSPRPRPTPPTPRRPPS